MNAIPLRRPEQRPQRILLVEDEIFIRMDVAATLRKAGFEVIEAARADAALEFVQSGEPFDVVFTDVQTPGELDGLGLTELVLARYPMVPVLIGSGNENFAAASSADSSPSPMIPIASRA